MSSGLYEIQINSYFYHGSSKNIKKRIICHINKLKHNKHPNLKMQAIFNKYNEFNYEVILSCKEEDLEYLEQCIIDAHIGDKYCMNLAAAVGNPMRGRKHSEETKAKMSAATLGKPKGKGKKDSDEVRAKKKEAALKRGIAPDVIERMKQGRANYLQKQREIKNASSI